MLITCCLRLNNVGSEIKDFVVWDDDVDDVEEDDEDDDVESVVVVDVIVVAGCDDVDVDDNDDEKVECWFWLLYCGCFESTGGGVYWLGPVECD